MKEKIVVEDWEMMDVNMWNKEVNDKAKLLLNLLQNQDMDGLYALSQNQKWINKFEEAISLSDSCVANVYNKLNEKEE